MRTRHDAVAEEIVTSDVLDPLTIPKIKIFIDSSLPPNSFELCSGTQRVRVINVGRGRL